MSLLMKALKKAEYSQTSGLPGAPGEALTLTPLDSPTATPKKQNASTMANAIPNQAAANLFHAKQPPAKSWLLLAVAAASTLLIAGGGAYLYFQLQAPPAITPLTRPIPVLAPTATVAPPEFTDPAPQAGPAMPTTSPLLARMEERQKTHTHTSKADSVPRTEDNIKITQESTSFTVNPVLTNAYQALRAGQTDIALSQYQRLLNSEPNNVDALLGMASIAAKQGRTEQSAKYYVRVLELDPKNAAAQTGLIGFMGKSDPASSEARLKQLLQTQPAAFLFFALGNLHAEQSQWLPAEQAYFQAFQMEPGNPDYAFNLAVSLEHLSQSRQALSFYQLALKLMQTNNNTHFDRRVLLSRISQLSAPRDLEDTK